jgi:hypothetical protein
VQPFEPVLSTADPRSGSTSRSFGTLALLVAEAVSRLVEEIFARQRSRRVTCRRNRSVPREGRGLTAVAEALARLAGGPGRVRLRQRKVEADATETVRDRAGLSAPGAMGTVRERAGLCGWRSEPCGVSVKVDWTALAGVIARDRSRVASHSAEDE